MHVNGQATVAVNSSKFRKIVTMLVATAVLTSLNVGCSLDATIQSLNQTIDGFSHKTVAEVTPGSEQGSAPTTFGREAQVSVSYESYEGASSKGKTTNGHTIYTNIQGSLFKE